MNTSTEQHLAKRWPIIGGAIALLGVLCLAGFVLTRKNAQAEAPKGMTHRVTRGELVVTVVEEGIVESAENIEIKSKVRGRNTVLWIIESGSFVEKGDELVRLDGFFIQEQIDERSKYSNWSQSAADRSAARLAAAKLTVSEYGEGRYRAEVMAAASLAAERSAGSLRLPSPNKRSPARTPSLRIPESLPHLRVSQSRFPLPRSYQASVRAFAVNPPPHRT